MVRPLALILLLTLSACEARPPASPPEVQHAEDVGTPLRGAPLGAERLPTTHHRIYVANLESRLESLETAVAEGSNVPPTAHASLASLYRSRFGYLGDLADLERALEQTELALQKLPSSPETLGLAADVALQAHQFQRAAALIEKAAAAGAKPEALASVRRELDWSQGRTDKAISAIRGQAKDNPSVHALVRLAVLERALGNAHASEKAFEQAEDAIVDTNPYTVAWLNFQRGLGLLDAGDPRAALPYLRESVARLPEYAAAQIHLAEALLARDPESPQAQSQAIEIYRPLAERGHPTAMGQLAMLTKAPEADQWRTRADDAFEALLQKHPALGAAHAAEYYAASNRLERSADLLAQNAELQPNAWAYTRWAEAELQADRLDAASKAANKARSAAHHPARLATVLEQIANHVSQPRGRGE